MNFLPLSRLLSKLRGFFWLLLMIPLLAHAQTPLYSALDDYLRIQTQGLPGKVTYSIGQLDARTQLPECTAFEPFLPAGSKLWGNSTVGVRCLGPSSWTIYVPVKVNVSGNYLISARTMPAGYVISAADIVVRSGDLSTLPANIITCLLYTSDAADE